jgi:sulfate adenylyltransferase
MGRDAWHRVLDDGVIVREGKRYAWGIPLSLPVTDAEARALAAGGSAALRSESGELIAVLDEIELFDWDKPKYVTTSTAPTASITRAAR